MKQPFKLFVCNQSRPRSGTAHTAYVAIDLLDLGAFGLLQVDHRSLFSTRRLTIIVVVKAECSNISCSTIDAPQVENLCGNCNHNACAFNNTLFGE